MKAALGRFFVRWYVTIVFALWAFVPEIRRVMDWKIGFSTLPVINLLPLLSLLPAIFFVKRTWPKLGRLYHAVAIFWLVGFGYALLVAYVSNGLIAGIYDVAAFVLPMGMGILLVVQSGSDMRSAYERTAQSLLWIAAIAGVYGIIQYLQPPAWDVFWVENAQLGSLGSPVPFQLRIFGPLNAPGPYADYLTLAILANLPRLSARALKTSLLMAPCLVALALSLVRTDWIGLVLAIVVYAVLSPRRSGAIGSLFTIAAVCTVFVVGLTATLPGAGNAIASVGTRFSSFSDLSEDSSVRTRQYETQEAIHAGLAEPLGQGAGTVGVAAKLGSNDGTLTIDNGYLARFLEMGWLGSLAYAVAVGTAFCGSFLAYMRLRRKSDVELTSFVAFGVALQAVLLYFDAASDHHVGFSALFFWYSLFITSRALHATAPRAESQVGFAVSQRLVAQ